MEREIVLCLLLVFHVYNKFIFNVMVINLIKSFSKQRGNCIQIISLKILFDVLGCFVIFYVIQNLIKEKR